jgi:hypothetical protein
VWINDCRAHSHRAHDPDILIFDGRFANVIHAGGIPERAQLRGAAVAVPRAGGLAEGTRGERTHHGFDVAGGERGV